VLATTPSASGASSTFDLEAEATASGLRLSAATLPFNIFSVRSNLQVARVHYMWGTTIKTVCKNKKHSECSLMLLERWYGHDETMRHVLAWSASAELVSEDDHWQTAQAIIRRGRKQV
jgi:hypothetical protein